MAEQDIRALQEFAPDIANNGDTEGAGVLRLARRSIEHGLVYREPLPVGGEELRRALAVPAATFTTLFLESRLRGCCGTLEAVRPLAADVAYSAFRAAFRDPRFAPVGRHELGSLRLEVSVLTPLESMPVSDEADLLGRLRPGIDGLVIDAGGRQATFLPRVWTTLPEPKQFLAALKAKCGLAENYWSDRLEFRRYRTTSYAESIT
jgi:AmmeMemoRadiSam system protein A